MKVATRVVCSLFIGLHVRWLRVVCEIRALSLLRGTDDRQQSGASRRRARANTSVPRRVQRRGVPRSAEYGVPKDAAVRLLCTFKSSRPSYTPSLSESRPQERVLL